MVPVEALKLALNQEIQAIKLYQGLAIKFPGNEIKDTFNFLINEEQRHKRLVEKLIYKMTRA